MSPLCGTYLQEASQLDRCFYVYVYVSNDSSCEFFCHTTYYLLETVTMRNIQQRIRIEVLVKLEKKSLMCTKFTVNFSKIQVSVGVK
jgi:hypothetical protein